MGRRSSGGSVLLQENGSVAALDAASNADLEVLLDLLAVPELRSEVCAWLHGNSALPDRRAHSQTQQHPSSVMSPLQIFTLVHTGARAHSGSNALSHIPGEPLS